MTGAVRLSIAGRDFSSRAKSSTLPIRRCSRSASPLSVVRYSAFCFSSVDEPARQQVEVKPQRGQRRPQFVRDGRDEADAALGQVEQRPAAQADRDQRDQHGRPRTTETDAERGPSRGWQRRRVH